MKKIITLVTCISLALLNYGQLANSSFEIWESPLLTNSYNVTGSIAGFTFYVCAPNFSYNELENWSSTNQLTNTPAFGSVELVSESSIAYSGTKSVQITSKSLTITAYLAPGCVGFSQSIDNVVPGLVANGSFNLDPQNLIDDILSGTGLNALNPFTYPGVGEAIDFIPKSISGYYNYTGAVDATTGQIDSFVVVSGLKKNGVVIGYCTERFGNTSSFTPFSVEYTHLNCEIPDTIVTVISASSLAFEIIDGEFILNDDNTGIDGSVLFIDALHLDTILPSEFPPILLSESVVLVENTSASVNILANDTFCDGNILTPILNYSGTEGVASINTSNELEFVPTTGFLGTVTIPYYSCNTVPLCDTAYLTITYEPLAICHANEDNYSLVQNQVSTKDPRLNDIDCGTSITIVAIPLSGVADLNFNGTINYSPNNDFVGTDSLTYSICNNLVTTQCDTASVYYSIVSGINEIGKDLIKFYPNPAKNSLNILVDVKNLIQVEIINTLGEKVLSSTFNYSKTIDLSSLNNGVYFVEIKTEGKKSVRKLQVIK